MIKIKRGMDIPIEGAPRQTIEDAPPCRTVAIVGPDYVGMKPTMEVAEGDRVKAGQLLFTDKKTEGLRYTAPAGGVVAAINRGARRVLQSVVIEVEGDASESFPSWDAAAARELEAAAIRENLNAAGQWTALRGRPFSRVPPSMPRLPRSSSPQSTPIHWRPSPQLLSWSNRRPLPWARNCWQN